MRTVREGSGVDDALATRIVDAMRRGIYRPANDRDMMDWYEARIAAKADTTEEDAILAASRLHPHGSLSSDDLPEVVLSGERITIVDPPEAGLDFLARVEEIGRINVATAIRLLSLPEATDREVAETRHVLSCIATSSIDASVESDDIVVVKPAFLDRPMILETLDVVDTTRRPMRDPEPRIAAVVPGLVMVRMQNVSNTKPDNVLIHPIEIPIWPDDRITPIEAMRTLSGMQDVIDATNKGPRP